MHKMVDFQLAEPEREISDESEIDA